MDRRLGRFQPPSAPGDRQMLGAGGVRLPRVIDAEWQAADRFRSQPPSAARVIAFQGSNAADQTINSTSYGAVTGTTFDLGLGGATGERWLVDLTATAIVIAWAAIDDECYLKIEVSIDGGTTWAAPDTNRTEQGAGGAWGWHDVGAAEAAATGVFQQIRCRAVFYAYPSDDLSIRLAGKVGGGGQTATVELTTTESSPKFLGSAVLHRLED